MHQKGISEKECFWMFLVLILEDSKSGAIRRPKDLIALGFLSWQMPWLGWMMIKCWDIDVLACCLLQNKKKKIIKIN